MKRSLLMVVGMVGYLSVLAAAARAGSQMEDTDAGHAPPVVYDNDVDFDDTVALAALAEQHLQGRIDLRAVTITNNGAGLPGKGYRHVRCLLDALGLADIPVADATYDLPHAFPDELRVAFDAVHERSIPLCAAGLTPPPYSASELLADAIANAKGRLTLIATGPLTNVALAMDLLDRQYPQGAAALIDRAYVQGGIFDESRGPEEPFGNIWGDPVAAQAIFTSLRPGALHLVPTEATDFVRIRSAYGALLTANVHTPAAQYVATLMNDPLMLFVVQAGLPIFWWDPLTVLSATNKGLVQYRRKRVEVIQEGVSSGRTTNPPTGNRMWAGVSANTALFESTLLNVLNGAESQP